MTRIIPKYIRTLTAIVFLFVIPLISYAQIDHSDHAVEMGPNSSAHESSPIKNSKDTKHQHLLDPVPVNAKLSRELGVRELLILGLK